MECLWERDVLGLPVVGTSSAVYLVVIKPNKFDDASCLRRTSTESFTIPIDQTRFIGQAGQNVLYI